MLGALWVVFHEAELIPDLTLGIIMNHGSECRACRGLAFTAQLGAEPPVELPPRANERQTEPDNS